LISNKRPLVFAKLVDVPVDADEVVVDLAEVVVDFLVDDVVIVDDCSESRYQYHS
jgi:hypothetical protein